MKFRVKLGFKNGLVEEVTFEVAVPASAKGDDDATLRKKAFDKVTRMVMTMGKQKGFINTGAFGFRVEDVSFLRLLD
jgi:hypothetical protein